MSCENLNKELKKAIKTRNIKKIHQISVIKNVAKMIPVETIFRYMNEIYCTDYQIFKEIKYGFAHKYDDIWKIIIRVNDNKDVMKSYLIDGPDCGRI